MYHWFTYHPKIAFFLALLIAFVFGFFVYNSEGVLQIVNFVVFLYWAIAAVSWFYKAPPPKPPLTPPTPPSKSSTIKDDSNI